MANLFGNPNHLFYTPEDVAAMLGPPPVLDYSVLPPSQTSYQEPNPQAQGGVGGGDFIGALLKKKMLAGGLLPATGAGSAIAGGGAIGGAGAVAKLSPTAAKAIASKVPFTAASVAKAQALNLGTQATGAASAASASPAATGAAKTGGLLGGLPAWAGPVGLMAGLGVGMFLSGKKRKKADRKRRHARRRAELAEFESRPLEDMQHDQKLAIIRRSFGKKHGDLDAIIATKGGYGYDKDAFRSTIDTSKGYAHALESAGVRDPYFEWQNEVKRQLKEGPPK